MKTNTLVLLFAFLCVNLFAQEVQEKYQRAKISYNSSDDIMRLIQLDVPMDHGMHKKGNFIISDFSVSELDRARKAGYKVDVIIENSTEHFLKQNKLNLAPEQSRNLSCPSGGSVTTYNTPANFNFGSMGGYFTYQELLDELDDMATLYPNLITTKADIGPNGNPFLTEGTPDNSVSPSVGGNGIKWVKISDNPNNNTEGEPQILYTSLHHSREAATLSQLVFYMWYLLENYDTDPEIKTIVDNTELYFVPVVNPDGYLHNQSTNPNGGGFWRKNRKNSHGVDNNRNYDYYINGNSSNTTWGGPGSSSSTGSETYHGTSAFSEVENQAMKWFAEQHNFVMAFNYHSFGQLLYFPFGYADLDTPDHDLYLAFTGEFVSQNGYTNLRDFPFAGDSDDFMYGTVGTHSKIFAMTPELGTAFWPLQNQIIGLCQEAMYMNLTGARSINNFATLTETSSTSTGNQNTVNADFDIRRLGITGTGDFTVSINPISANIIATGSPVSINSLVLLATDSGSISYTLDGSTQPGDAISFELIVNNGTYDSSILVNKTFGELTSIFLDPADSTTSNFTNNGWGTTTSTSVSAPSSITDSPSGNYGNSENKTIQLTNAIDLTTATSATLSFNARWDIEENWDYVQVQVSTNGGSTWIPQCGKFTNTGVANQAGADGEPVYDGTQTSWVLEEIDLSDYLGSSILIRFQLITDTAQVRDGFYFDDLEVKVIDTTLDTPDFIDENFVLYPNPVKDILTIKTTITGYNYTLYTIQGQIIQEKLNNNNVSTIDYSGLPSGIYLLNLEQNDSQKTYKIIKE